MLKKVGRNYYYPIEQIRQWIADGKTQAYVGEQLGVNPKLIYKVCKKHSITCQRTGPRSGEGHRDWKGGRIVDKDGYVLLYCPDHPRGRKHTKYVLEHRLVMEKKLGRLLEACEVVHHIDKDKKNNSPDNLEVFSHNSEHLKHELLGKCPNWTEDGKARIRRGQKIRADNMRRRKLHASLKQ